MIRTSIIIPTLNEEKYIAACLDSVLISDINKKSIEVLVIDANSNDKTVEIVEKYVNEYSYIKLLKNEKKIIPSGMNIGIKEAKGEYIIRIDAHAIYPKNYFTKLLQWSQKLHADNVGGTCVTDVKIKNAKTESIKAVFLNKMGVGRAEYRSEISEPKESNTIPYGCFKRKTLLKYGLFDERLERGEDLEINKRILDNGGKVYLVPEVSFTYYAKETMLAIMKKSFHTGKWIVLSVYLTKNIQALHLRHFIPLLFILSLIIPLFVSLIYPESYVLSLLSLLIYSISILFLSLKIKGDNNSFYYLVLTFITLHFSYGLGSLTAIFEIFLKKMKKG